MHKNVSVRKKQNDTKWMKLATHTLLVVKVAYIETNIYVTKYCKTIELSTQNV